jgi:hypothetical protein
MKVYELFHNQGEDGSWYREFEVPEGFPIQYGFTSQPIPETINFPRWNWSTGEWMEDVEQLKQHEINELKQRNEELTQAFLELSQIVLGGEEV